MAVPVVLPTRVVIHYSCLVTRHLCAYGLRIPSLCPRGKEHRHHAGLGWVTTFRSEVASQLIGTTSTLSNSAC